MKQDAESVFAIMAAMLVLFTAMLAPSASVILSISLLVSFSIYKYKCIDKKNALKPFLFSGIVACLAILVWSALHDIIKSRQQSYYMEYIILVFAIVAIVVLFLKIPYLCTHANSPKRRTPARKKRK